MAGTLFVLVRVPQGKGYAVLAGPTDSAGAVAAGTDFLQKNPGGRVVVANAIRSFTSAATVTEDAAVTID